MPVVPFNRERHGPFVFDAWSRGAGLSRSELRRILMTGADCLVRIGAMPVEMHGQLTDLCMSFVVVRNNHVLWAYTKPVYRNQGFMVELLDRAGIDTTGPVVMATRSGPSDLICKALNKRGWKIVFGDDIERQNTEDRKAEYPR